MTSTKEINETPINKNRVNSISSESHDPKYNEKIIKIDATNITNRNQKGKSKGKMILVFLQMILLHIAKKIRRKSQ